MPEPIIIKLKNETSWDGVTPVPLSREDFENQGSHYVGSTPQGGSIAGDFFGLLSQTRPKVVSVACNSVDPRTLARVTPPAFPDRARFEVDLLPTFQSMLMVSTDVLRIVSKGGDPGTRQLTIIVNEVSEEEAVRIATLLESETRMVRHRIVREDDLGFALATTNPLLASDFDYSASIGYLTASTSGQGYVGVKELVSRGSEGAYVRVRFTGIADGEGDVYLIDPRTDESRVVQSGLKSPLWSEPIWLAREDRLGFRSSTPPANTNVALEFEVSEVRYRRV